MRAFIAICLFTCSLFVLSACTGRELATGAAAGAAGYVIGHEAGDNDDD